MFVGEIPCSAREGQKYLTPGYSFIASLGVSRLKSDRSSTSFVVANKVQTFTNLIRPIGDDKIYVLANEDKIFCMRGEDVVRQTKDATSRRILVCASLQDTWEYYHKPCPNYKELVK